MERYIRKFQESTTIILSQKDRLGNIFYLACNGVKVWAWNQHKIPKSIGQFCPTSPRGGEAEAVAIVQNICLEAYDMYATRPDKYRQVVSEQLKINFLLEK